MKRQFELKKGKTHLFWEVERDGTLLMQRSWGRNRKEHASTKRFRSDSSAKRGFESEIEFQLRRGFVEFGRAGEKNQRARPITDGSKAMAAAKGAIVRTTIPALRTLGFQGTFPNFRRVEKDRHSVVSFLWGPTGGSVTVELAVVPPKSGTTPVQDLKRAIDIRNRQRVSLRGVGPEREWKLHSFYDAAEKWGADWPEHLASLLKTRLVTTGMRWLGDPGRRSNPEGTR